MSPPSKSQERHQQTERVLAALRDSEASACFQLTNNLDDRHSTLWNRIDKAFTTPRLRRCDITSAQIEMAVHLAVEAGQVMATFSPAGLRAVGKNVLKWVVGCAENELFGFSCEDAHALRKRQSLIENRDTKNGSSEHEMREEVIVMVRQWIEEIRACPNTDAKKVNAVIDAIKRMIDLELVDEVREQGSEHAHLSGRLLPNRSINAKTLKTEIGRTEKTCRAWLNLTRKSYGAYRRRNG